MDRDRRQFLCSAAAFAVLDPAVIGLHRSDVWPGISLGTDDGQLTWSPEPPLGDEVAAAGAGEEWLLETRSAIMTTSIPSDVSHMRTAGYLTVGDGGGALYERVGAEPSHPFKVQSDDGAWWEGVPENGVLDPRVLGATGDGATDDTVALARWLTSDEIGRSLYLPQGIYLTSAKLTATENPHKLIGGGWQRNVHEVLTGTIIAAWATSVADLLEIRSSRPSRGPASEIQGLVLEDFGLVHRGSGTGLHINNINRLRIRNLFIDCHNEGAVGMALEHYAFFAALESLVIRRFTDKGLVIEGRGSQHVIRDCHIYAGNESATVALEIRRHGFLVDGGQYNVNRADSTGVGILVYNPESHTQHGGRIRNIICERDIGIEIDGETDVFRGVTIEIPFFNLGNVAKGVVFNRAWRCILDRPVVAAPLAGGTLVEFGADSGDCGVICDYDAAIAPIIVRAGATRAWKNVYGVVGYSNRANITTDPNLITTCEHVEGVGRTKHNGTSWDKYRESVANDGVVAITPPRASGLVQVATTNGQGEFILATFKIAGAASAEGLAVGSAGRVETTDGPLTGTTGTDGKVTIRADSASGMLYLENRSGSQRSFNVTFKDVL